MTLLNQKNQLTLNSNTNEGNKMSEPMKIGVSNFDGGGGGFTKKEYFWLKANENNLYRVLPPLFSLADRGQYAKYHASHKVVIIDAPPAGSNDKGKYNVYQFLCVEKTDSKTKLIQNHCPFCDQARAAKATHEDAKQRGAGKEQLKEFYDKQISPFEAEKKFYINAVNLENKVGLLPLGIKNFKALQDRLKDVQINYGGLDATGVNGLFLNFKKTQKFKGDRDTVYTVDLAMDTSMVNGQPQMQLKTHVLTTDFIETVRTSARDLGELYKSVSPEEMMHIIQATPETKKQLLDKLFGRGEKVGNPTTSHMNGVTGVEVVTRMDLAGGNMTLHTPDPFKSTQTIVDVKSVPAMGTIPAQSTTPQVTPQPAPAISLAMPGSSLDQGVSVKVATPVFPVNPMMPPVAPMASTGSITDEEFIRLFGGQ